MSVHKRNSKKKQITVQNTKVNTLAILPLILIVAVVPLIIYIKVTKLNAIESYIMGANNVLTDMFSYYKMVYFLVFAAVGLLAMMFSEKLNLLQNDKKKYYIPAGLFVLLVFMSSVASGYKSTSFLGFWGRYEGAIVIIAYIAVMLVAMNILREEKHIMLLFICLFGSAAIIAILGALQLIGIDYFNSDFVLNLITPSALKKTGGHMEATFGAGTLFSTLYNPNYVGSYMAMLMPAIIVFIVYLKKISHKLILVALLCLVAINWIGCDSRAGVIGGAFAVIVILVMLRKKILQHRIIAISVAVLLLGGMVIANFATGGSVLNRLERLATFESKDSDTTGRNAMLKTLQGLEDIKVDKDMTRIVTDKGSLQIILSGGRLNITDETNHALNTSISENVVSITDSRFSNIELHTKPDEGLIEIFYNGYDLISLLNTEDGFASTSNRWMTSRGNNNIETFGSVKIETFGSYRGYIWSRTIPLLKNAILLGYGPDTFPIIFPQYDYIGKLRNYGTGGIFVDKAHNMYLQTAINSGVISLLALLALFGIYIVSSIKIYIREKFDSFLPFAGLACFTSFCGYIITGLFNDSVISVAPVFWVLLGLGIGINVRMMSNKQVNILNKYAKQPEIK